MTTVRRGTLLSFNPATWTAYVLLDGADQEAQIPVGQWVPTVQLVAGVEVAVLQFDPTNTDDGVVLGAYGAVGSLSTSQAPTFGGLNLGSATGAATGSIKASLDGTFAGGLNVGTATGAAAGQIKASGAATINGALIWTTDNASDIGASGATRPRNIYLAGTIQQSTPLGARAFHNAAQATVTATLLPLALNQERWDTDTIHDLVTNNSRLTCKTAGKYLITGTIEYAANVTGHRAAYIRLNGATFIATELIMAVTTAAQATQVSVSTIYDLAVSDYVELLALQNSGGGLNVNSTGNYSPEFSMIRIA